jgi:hypothetical protein
MMHPCDAELVRAALSPCSKKPDRPSILLAGSGVSGRVPDPRRFVVPPTLYVPCGPRPLPAYPARETHVWSSCRDDDKKNGSASARRRT